MNSRPTPVAAEDEKVNILLVDDQPEGLMALEAILGGLAQNLVQARSGEEALRHVLRFDFALVLLDVHMPGMDGFETATLIRARDRSRHTPILFLTASYLEDEQMFRAYAVGAVDYVLKPVVPEVLRSKVSIFVELAKKDVVLRRQASWLQEAQALVAKHALDLERKVQERTRDLRQAEEKYRLLVEQIPSAIYVASADNPGEVVYFSPQVERLLGFPPGDWIADPAFWKRAVHPDDQERVNAESGHMRATGQPLSVEYRMLARDGRVVWVRDDARLMSGHGGASVVQGLITDITEGKRAIEAGERQRETLYQTEKLAAMGQLLAGVAHEINNPLAVIVGHASLLRRSAPEGPLARRAEQIDRAAERCTRIVRNFLALARQRPPERAHLGLNEVVQEALELLSYPLHADGVEVELDLADGLPILWADTHQLHQVIVNLVTNAHHALRACPPPHRMITLATRLDPGRGGVVLEVADNGPGIPPEVQARIFEPFFTTKPVGEGTGLGLSLCRGIVENHGGSITVQSEPGHGTVFRIHLPVGASHRAASDPPPSVTGRVDGKAILVVDDEESLAALVAEMLTGAGHRVQTAGSGQAALAKLDASIYDMVVSDVRMPDMDGPSLWGEACLRHPQMARRFLFLTGDTLAPGTREFLEKTQNAHLAKPFSDPELQQAVARVLAPEAPP